MSRGNPKPSVKLAGKRLLGFHAPCGGTRAAPLVRQNSAKISAPPPK